MRRGVLKRIEYFAHTIIERGRSICSGMPKLISRSALETGLNPTRATRSSFSRLYPTLQIISKRGHLPSPYSLDTNSSPAQQHCRLDSPIRIFTLEMPEPIMLNSNTGTRKRRFAL